MMGLGPEPRFFELDHPKPRAQPFLQPGLQRLEMFLEIGPSIAQIQDQHGLRDDLPARRLGLEQRETSLGSRGIIQQAREMLGHPAALCRAVIGNAGEHATENRSPGLREPLVGDHLGRQRARDRRCRGPTGIEQRRRRQPVGQRLRRDPMGRQRQREKDKEMNHSGFSQGMAFHGAREPWTGCRSYFTQTPRKGNCVCMADSPGERDPATGVIGKVGAGLEPTALPGI